MTARRSGFTLIELLIAAAITGILLAVLGQLFVATTRSYRVNETVARTQQQAEIAATLLTYDVGLAGYRGSDASASSRTFPSPDARLVIVKSATTGGSDVVRTRYYEDRYVASTGLTDVRYSVGTDADGTPALLRSIDGGTAQPALRGVQRLEVATYVRADGTRATATSTTPVPTGTNPMVAIEVVVTFVDDYQTRMTIGFRNLDLEAHPEYVASSDPDQA